VSNRVHLVNIVTLETGDKYVVDAGFGGDGPTLPLPLIAHRVHTNLGAQEVRYEYASIPQFRTDHKFWIYQYRNGQDRPWNSYYCFNETPYLDEDFEILSYFVSHAPSNQTENVLIVRFTREGEKIVGKRTMENRNVKENTGGKTRMVMQCKDEAERVRAIKEYFDITLLDKEISGIIGTSTQLPL
jgi:arylamine N-acetyltransferase